MWAAKRAWAWAGACAAMWSGTAVAQAMCRVPGDWEEAAAAWLLWPLAACVLGYAAGLWRLWRGRAGQAGVGRGVPVAAAAGTMAGWLLLALLAAGGSGGGSLAGHMGRHMVLLALVPPLLLAGRPVAVAMHALPAPWMARMRERLRTRVPSPATALVAATIAHCAAMWLWHLPLVLQAALAAPVLHWAMQASLLLAGLWFWAALWRRLRDPDGGIAGALVAAVAVMMQMGFLGALLTFSPRPLHPAFAAGAIEIGLDPLSDQQLAGLLMWVPGCVPYLAGALWLTWRWFARLEPGGTAAAPASGAGPPPPQ